MQFYYIYRITNIVEKKHYYGYRGTNIKPKDDLGKKYFSSSTDKKFINLQKTNPEQFKYKIIKVFTEKKDAILMEVKLHKMFDVKSHPSFYNLSNQLSLGFTTNNKGREGLKGSDNGMTKEINIYNADRELVYVSKGDFPDFCKRNNLPLTTLRNSYYNSGRPMFQAKDRKTWAIKNGYTEFIGWYAMYSYEENHSKEVYDKLVEMEEKTDYKKRRLVSNRTRGNKNNLKDINIYNSKRELVYSVKDAFFEFCDKMGLPKSALNVSQENDGEPIFQTMYGISRATKSGQSEFIGWYAKAGDNLTEEEYEIKVNEIKQKDLQTREKKAASLSAKKINGKKINIYDSEGNLKYETNGNFKEICEKNNLPYALGASHRKNGEPIFQSIRAKKKAIKDGTKSFIGWYAKKI